MFPPPGLEREVLVIVVTSTFAFLVFYYALRTREPTLTALTLQRVLGGLVLGGIPALTAHWIGSTADLALRLPSLQHLSFALGLWALAVVFPGIASRHPSFREHYPEVRARVWTREMHAQNALAWAVYLFGYELLFRGFLLHGLATRLGAWPAIAVSTGLYALAHLHKNAGETFACIPFGIATAMLSLEADSFLPLWFVHLGIVLTSEALARSGGDK